MITNIEIHSEVSQFAQAAAAYGTTGGVLSRFEEARDRMVKFIQRVRDENPKDPIHASPTKFDPPMHVAADEAARKARLERAQFKFTGLGGQPVTIDEYLQQKPDATSDHEKRIALLEQVYVVVRDMLARELANKVKLEAIEAKLSSHPSPEKLLYQEGQLDFIKESLKETDLQVENHGNRLDALEKRIAALDHRTIGSQRIG